MPHGNSLHPNLSDVDVSKAQEHSKRARGPGIRTGEESPVAPVLAGVDCFFLMQGRDVCQCPALHKQRVLNPLFEPKFRGENESRKLRS